jgi:hypothetical protein
LPETSAPGPNRSILGAGRGSAPGRMHRRSRRGTQPRSDAASARRDVDAHGR